MILAIDQGTTGTTCIVFDEEGRPRGRSYSEFEQHFPRPGWVEHDASEIWEVTRRVAAEAISAAGIDGELTITTDLTGQTFYPGEDVPSFSYTGSLTGFPIITQHVVLEADGELLGVGPISRFPHVSTDSARLAVRAAVAPAVNACSCGFSR